jgi:hypothetical protein
LNALSPSCISRRLWATRPENSAGVVMDGSFSGWNGPAA